MKTPALPHRIAHFPSVTTLVALALVTAVPAQAKPKAKATAAAAQPATPQPDPRWPFQLAKPDAKKPEAAETSGGLGIVLGEKDGDIFVQNLIPGGPAQKAGVHIGDILVATDALPAIHGTPLPQVTPHIRGVPGTVCKTTLKRGQETLHLDVTRVSMKRLFPPTAKDVLLAMPGRAVLAVGARHAMAVSWLSLTPGWVTVKVTESGPEKPFGVTQERMLEVALSGEATSLQLDDWKLDLRRVPDSSNVAVTGSNLALYDVAATPAAWQPEAWPEPITPRGLLKLTAKWRGPVNVPLRAMSGGKPVAEHRVTLRIAQGGKELDTVTVVTDAQGHFQIGVADGPFTVRGLSQSTPGGHHDAAFPFQLTRDVELIAHAGGAEQTLTLEVRPPQQGNVDDWQKDERVGQGLPMLDVQRWFGEKPQEPKTLQGEVLLVYLWATWCGPCRATAPQIAELNVRLAGKNIHIIEASVDRDEQALELFHKDFLPGAPAVAWTGPDALETLEISSIPTFIVVDHTGKIRGLRRGGGWSVDALQAWLEKLGAEAKAANPR